ncbi:MAG: protein translocase subunit SecD [Polyangiaceae bacterium]|nr:protein translocase subunit SecD [Polyangiaceae bacterium]
MLAQINPLTFVYGAFAAMFLALGWVKRAHRVSLWLAAGLAASGAASAYFHAFWPMVMFGILALWSGFVAVEWIDVPWRLRAGLVFTLITTGFFVLWPSLERLSGGKLPCPSYVEEHSKFRLVAGLDLRGGLRLVYTVDVDEAVKDKRDRYYEQMRAELAKVYGLHSGDELPSEEALAKLRDKVAVEAPRKPANEIRFDVKDDPSKIDERFLERFRADLTYTQGEDKKKWVFRVREIAESGIRDRAVAQAKDIILRRVDDLGLREASVSTRNEDIIVEVPGEDEASFATIRDIISQTARLEFKLLDDETDYLAEVAKTATKESLPEGLEFAREVAPVGLDENGDQKNKQITYAYLKKKPEEKIKDALTRFKEWAGTLTPPPDRELGFELVYETNPDTLKQSEAGWRTYLLKSRAEITGAQVTEAQAQPDQQGGRAAGGWHVALTFTESGGKAFERITGANVKKRFAIMLDGRVESTPVILNRIAGGHAQITMGAQDPDIQLRDARKLELVLRSGALPAPISPSNEQRIGPSLGKEAIGLAVRGSGIGAGLVLLFMFLYYKRGGLIADVAVITNIFLQLATLATFGASMTLPGIAGIALTVGMGVDANVLINERIREEQRAGKSARAAIEVGFNRALSAIVDGNLTTLISGIVLAQYGSGPVKGFAVTLTVGVLINLFTAVVVSRMFFELWARGFGRKTHLDIG